MREPQEEESGSSYGRQKEDLPTEDEEIDVDDEDSTASNEPLCLTRNDKVRFTKIHNLWPLNV